MLMSFSLRIGPFDQCLAPIASSRVAAQPCVSLQRFVTARGAASVIPCTSVGVGGLFRDGHQRREVSGESPRDQYGRRRRALQRHIRAGIGDAHEQSRRCSERPRARPKRALRVQSVPVLVATELLPRLPLRLWVVLRLWTKLLRLWTKLRLWTRRRLWTKLPAVPLKAASRRKLKPLQPPGRCGGWEHSPHARSAAFVLMGRRLPESDELLRERSRVGRRRIDLERGGG